MAHKSASDQADLRKILRIIFRAKGVSCVALMALLALVGGVGLLSRMLSLFKFFRVGR